MGFCCAQERTKDPKVQPFQVVEDGDTSESFAYRPRPERKMNYVKSDSI